MAAPAEKNRRAASAEEHRQHVAQAAEAGRRIAECAMSERQARALVKAFKSQLLPPRPRGRRDTERITKAYEDWKSGLRRDALFEKHIPRWKRMGYYERDHKRHRLMSSITKRRRKEEKAQAEAQAASATKSESVAATKSEAVSQLNPKAD